MVLLEWYLTGWGASTSSFTWHSTLSTCRTCSSQCNVAAVSSETAFQIIYSIFNHCRNVCNISEGMECCHVTLLGDSYCLYFSIFCHFFDPNSLRPTFLLVYVLKDRSKVKMSYNILVKVGITPLSWANASLPFRNGPLLSMCQLGSWQKLQLAKYWTYVLWLGGLVCP